jgi:hypothetical protein
MSSFGSTTRTPTGRGRSFKSLRATARCGEVDRVGEQKPGRRTVTEHRPGRHLPATPREAAREYLRRLHECREQFEKEGKTKTRPGESCTVPSGRARCRTRALTRRGTGVSTAKERKSRKKHGTREPLSQVPWGNNRSPDKEPRPSKSTSQADVREGGTSTALRASPHLSVVSLDV